MCDYSVMGARKTGMMEKPRSMISVTPETEIASPSSLYHILIAATLQSLPVVNLAKKTLSGGNLQQGVYRNIQGITVDKVIQR
jgi:hypothetical protein